MLASFFCLLRCGCFIDVVVPLKKRLLGRYRQINGTVFACENWWLNGGAAHAAQATIPGSILSFLTRTLDLWGTVETLCNTEDLPMDQKIR